MVSGLLVGSRERSIVGLADDLCSFVSVVLRFVSSGVLHELRLHDELRSCLFELRFVYILRALQHLHDLLRTFVQHVRNVRYGLLIVLGRYGDAGGLHLFAAQRRLFELRGNGTCKHFWHVAAHPRDVLFADCCSWNFQHTYPGRDARTVS